jgi:hypothetical protein
MRKSLSLLLCFVPSAIVFIAGLILAGLYGFRQIPDLFEETARGLLPQGFEANLLTKGKYTVWLPVEVKSESERERDWLPPGGQLYLFDSASEQELELVTSGNKVKFIGDEKSVSLGSFETQKDGQIIEVKATGLAEPVLISISLDDPGKKLATIFTLIAIVVITLMTAISLFVFSVHRWPIAKEAALKSA